MSRIHRIIHIGVITLTVYVKICTAQQCEQIYLSAISLTKATKPNFQLAIKKLTAYKLCCNDKGRIKADSLLLEIFKTVNQLKDDAVIAEKKAIQQRNIAEKATQKAQARTLMLLAREYSNKNPTVSFRLAELAWKKSKFEPPSEELCKILYDVFYGSIDSKNLLYEHQFDHSNAITSAKFTTDGKKIITISNDNSAKVWDMHSGRLLFQVAGKFSLLITSYFVTDGNKILACHGDKSCEIWDACTGNLVSTLETIDSYINTAKFSNNGKLIAASCNDRKTRIWDVNSGKLLVTFQAESDGDVTFSPDDTQLLTTAWSGNPLVWDVSSGTLIENLAQRTLNLRGLACKQIFFSPGGQEIAAVTNNNSVEIWNAKTCEYIGNLLGHTKEISSISFSPIRNEIATASYDSTVKIWNLDSFKLITEIREHSPLISTSFSFDGKLLATSSRDSTAKIWDATNGKFLYNLVGHKQSLTSVAFSPTANYVVTTSTDATAKMWRLTDLTKAIESQKLEFKLKDKILSPNNKYRLEATSGYQGVISENKTNKIISILIGHSADISDACFSPDNQRIVTTSKKNEAIVWDVNTGKLLHRIGPNKVFGPIISRDGTEVVTSAPGGSIQVWNIASGNLIRNFYDHQEDVLSRGFSPDGKIIATAGLDRSLKIWDYKSARIIGSIKVESNFPYRIEFSEDDKAILVYFMEGEVKKYPTAKGIIDFMETHNFYRLTDKDFRDLNIDFIN